MVSRSISIDIDVSIQTMLQLDDADNILISRLDTLWMYRRMLLDRLAETGAQGATIHLRPALLDMNESLTASLLDSGVNMTLWEETLPVSLHRYSGLVQVKMQRTPSPIESFLVINTPSWGRILAAWQRRDRIQGVLVTNQRLVQQALGQLNMFVHSATR